MGGGERCLHVGESEPIVGSENVGGDCRETTETPLVRKRETGVVDTIGGREVGEVREEIAVGVADLLVGLLDLQHLADAQRNVVGVVGRGDPHAENVHGPGLVEKRLGDLALPLGLGTRGCCGACDELGRRDEIADGLGHFLALGCERKGGSHLFVHEEAVRDERLEGELLARDVAGKDAALEPAAVLVASLEVASG